MLMQIENDKLGILTRDCFFIYDKLGLIWMESELICLHQIPSKKY